MAPLPFHHHHLHHHLRPSAIRQVEAAYTLVELLVGVVLGSIVLGALGGALLVSEMRVSTRIRKDLERKDALNRAVALMRQEISSAGKISINPNQPPLSSNPCGPPSLYLWRAPATIICYKPMSISSSAITKGYPSISDRPWTGPCVLVRQGPPYKANGELDTSSPVVIQVLVDHLVACSPVTAAMDLKVTSSGSVASNSTSRDVDVTINQNGGIATSFSARTASNPLYAGMDMYVDTPCPTVAGASSTTCYSGTNSIHYIPSMKTTGGSLVTATTMAGQSDKENVFYFQYARSAYTLQQSASSTQPCTYSSCYVLRNGTPASVQLSNADVLVFADGELRP